MLLLMQNSIYKIKYLLFLSWNWEAWCLTVWGVISPPPERNTAWNKGRKCFHCLGAPNNLVRPWLHFVTIFISWDSRECQNHGKTAWPCTLKMEAAVSSVSFVPIDRNSQLHVPEDCKMHTELWLGNLEERDHLEDLSIDGWIILKGHKEMWWKSVDWRNEDSDMWRAVVNTVMNIWDPLSRGNFLTEEARVPASQRELCYWELVYQAVCLCHQ